MNVTVTLFDTEDMPRVFQEQRRNNQSLSSNGVNSVITLQAKLLAAIRSFSCPRLSVAFFCLLIFVPDLTVCQ